MKKTKLDKLKKLLREILEKSFKYCEHEDAKVSDDSCLINAAAHECLKQIEREPEDVED